MPLTEVTKKSIIDVTGVLDTPLELATIKSLKMNNYGNVNKNENVVKRIFRPQIS